MNFTQAKELYFSELMQQENCLTKEELVARIGKTTIRCGWVDFVDDLIKDKQVKEYIAKNWGQVI